LLRAKFEVEVYEQAPEMTRSAAASLWRRMRSASLHWLGFGGGLDREGVRPRFTHHAEQQRAAAAAKTWLLAQIAKKRAAPAADIMATAPDQAFAPERLAA
jgi:hypothetical protein